MKSPQKTRGDNVKTGTQKNRKGREGERTKGGYKKLNMSVTDQTGS